MKGTWLKFWNKLRKRLRKRATKELDHNNKIRKFIHKKPANFPQFEIGIGMGIKLSFHGGTEENPHPDVHLDVKDINRFEEIKQYRGKIEEKFGEELGWGNGTENFPIYFHLTNHDVDKKIDYMVKPNLHLWPKVIDHLIDEMIRFYKIYLLLYNSICKILETSVEMLFLFNSQNISKSNLSL